MFFGNCTQRTIPFYLFIFYFIFRFFYVRTFCLLSAFSMHILSVIVELFEKDISELHLLFIRLLHAHNLYQAP